MLTTTMTREEVIKLSNGLFALGGLKGGPKYCYAIEKNRRLLESEINAILKAQEWTEDYREYEQAREQLCIQHAQKEESGEPKITNGQYVLADKTAFEKEWAALKEKHKAAIEAHDERQKQVTEMLKESVSVQLHLVKFDVFPEGITPKLLSEIWPIIVEE